MEIAIVLFVVWAVVTVFGHTSWVIVRAISRAFIRAATLPDPPNPLAEQRVDILATRRVINRLISKNLLDESTATELRDQLRNLEQQPALRTPLSITPAPITPRDDRSVDSAVDFEATDKRAPTNEVPTAETDQEEPILASLAGTPKDDFFPPPRSQPSPLSKPVQAAPSTPAEPSAPLLSKSELIQSFLAAHNIRWGELVAGMLIVICSIGLVISLWNTLVETHRVIPSLVFLGANAAIYAAGLYTLSRWRLRHTSRAVLVIATLLVPLSVLAGLAAAGTSANAVQLGDPITIAAIGLASVVYIFLLYLSGKALSRRIYAAPLALSVAGPIAVLPLVPAAIRTWDTNAGWIISIGSIAVAIASFWMVRLHKRENLSLGVAGGRTRLLVMGFGIFSLAVAIGYMTFALRGFGAGAWLPIGIATVPAMIVLAGASRSLMIAARSVTQSMTGAVLCCVLIGLAWTILPASMGGENSLWIWSWAAAFSLSAACVGWFFGQPLWLPFATIPLGMAATFSSPVWLGGHEWAAVPLSDRLFGGEPMIAATLIAIGVAALMQLISDPLRRKWIGYAAVIWTGVALVIAVVLAVAPDARLGVAPWWSVTMVLAASSLATIYFATWHHAWAFATVGSVSFGWLSFYRPVQWDVPLTETLPRVWMTTLLSITVSLLVIREFSPRLAILLSGDRRITRRSGVVWQNASVGVALIAATVACLSVRYDWADSALALVAVSIVILWLSSYSRSIELIRVSQLATIALAIVVGYGRFGHWLFDKQAWVTATAPWAWSLLAASVAGLWLVIRQIAFTDPALLKHRWKHLACPKAIPSLMPDGWAGAISAVFVSVGATWTFADVLMQTTGTGAGIGMNLSGMLYPISAIVACGVVTWGAIRQLAGSGFADEFDLADRIASSLIVAGVVWGSCQIANLFVSVDAPRLVVATTLAVIGCLGLPLLISTRTRLNSPETLDRLSKSVVLLVLTVSSAFLLETHWIAPILDRSRADAIATISVASWWMVAAVGLLWQARHSTSPAPIVSSALLAPVAAALVVPVFSLTHPVFWVQVAAIASVSWVTVSQIWLRQTDRQSALAQPAIDGSMLFAMLIGVTTSLFVMLGITLDLALLGVWSGFAGLSISVLAVVLWCRGELGSQTAKVNMESRLPWPIGVSILSGQIAWLVAWFGLVDGIHTVELIAAIWCVAAAASLVRYRIDGQSLDFVHVGLANLAVTIIAIVLTPESELMPWLSLAVLAAGGLLVALVGRDLKTTKTLLVAARILGWFIVVAGGFVLVSQIATGTDPSVQWTMLVVWTSIWVIAWRWTCADFLRSSNERNEQQRHQLLASPDLEFAVLLLVAPILEVFLCTFGARPFWQASVIADPLLLGRVVAYLALSFSTITRASRGIAWKCGIGTLVATTSLVAVELAIHFDATNNQRFMWAALPSGFMIAFVSHWLPAIARQAARLSGESISPIFHRLVQSCWQIALVVAGSGGMLAVLMILGDASPSETQLTIVSVAMAAWAIAEMAQASNSSRLRQAAMICALITIGLWASVDSGETSHVLLTASMRWLVASVITIPMLLFVFSKLLGAEIANQWRTAFHRGASVAAYTAGVSLISMLVMEVSLRTQGGIEGISWPLVIGVAVTLSILSALTGLVAVLSGPGSTWPERLGLSDQQRVQLIAAAQVIAAIACLHILLCKDWSFLGLRAYWPYVVMGLAFLSVGATQWAQRRKDAVLSKTLSQTALYLPLIPVVGFWFSGSINESSWTFIGERVRYDLLLAVGSVYYIGISALWTGAIPRVSAVVLGNAAWWVVLCQQPGWNFLAHPQAWLIPPAVCVLVVAHLYHDRLDPMLSSGIRYGATLVIYISSTADIMLRQIGTNIYGPIFLILLSLAGMTAGVVLRVRPFLYLGATFVFIGVTSMVWHAQRSIDAVWPWWVFGITAGILLLAALMAIEKNKPTLREYANNLATWQG